MLSEKNSTKTKIESNKSIGDYIPEEISRVLLMLDHQLRGQVDFDLSRKFKH